MKPLVALLGFMLSTFALFLQPTPNPENSNDSIEMAAPKFLETYDEPVEFFTESNNKEIL